MSQDITPSMQDLAIYFVEASEWRFGIDNEGNVYVIGQDIAKTIGYRDASDAVRMLDDDEYGTQQVRLVESSGVYKYRPMIVIYEDGIYELFFRSTLPGAKAMKKRVKQILKEIRLHGGFIRDDISIEQLARMREISDYKIVRDIVARASDYVASSGYTSRVYAEIQNAYLVKVSGMNKNQLISSGREVVTYKGKRGPTKEDRETGKNYLNHKELVALRANVAVTVAMIWRDLLEKESYTMNDIQRLIEKTLNG